MDQKFHGDEMKSIFLKNFTIKIPIKEQKNRKNHISSRGIDFFKSSLVDEYRLTQTNFACHTSAAYEFQN
jgi:hypothetical protein